MAKTNSLDIIDENINIPNADTLAAIAEVEAMKKNPAIGKAYNSVDEMLEDITE